MGKEMVRQHRLANGLHVIGECNDACQSAALGFFVRTGSRDEEAPESGVSHFLEHMMFKGTATRGALDITMQLGNMGAQANAFTSEENTVFYGAVVPQYFSRLQELLSDMLRPALDQHEFDTEKKVILEEIALYQDRPHFYLFEHAMREYFAGHTAGNSVLGSSESISALSRDQMKAYFERRYRPSNITLVAAGNFDFERFAADAEKYCGFWPDSEVQRDVSPHQGAEVSKEYAKNNLSQAHVLLISPGCSAQDDERYALGVLATIIGDSTGSRLYWELVNSGMAESAGCDSDEKDGTGCFVAYASTEPERLDEVGAVLQRVVSSALEFSDDDLERAKTKLAARIVLDGETPMGRLMSLGNEWVYRRKIHNLKDTVRRLRAVSHDEIRAALDRYPLRSWSEFRLLPRWCPEED